MGVGNGRVLSEQLQEHSCEALSNNTSYQIKLRKEETSLRLAIMNTLHLISRNKHAATAEVMNYQKRNIVHVNGKAGLSKLKHKNIIKLNNIALNTFPTVGKIRKKQDEYCKEQLTWVQFIESKTKNTEVHGAPTTLYTTAKNVLAFMTGIANIDLFSPITFGHTSIHQGKFDGKSGKEIVEIDIEDINTDADLDNINDDIFPNVVYIDWSLHLDGYVSTGCKSNSICAVCLQPTWFDDLGSSIVNYNPIAMFETGDKHVQVYSYLERLAKEFETYANQGINIYLCGCLTIYINGSGIITLCIKHI